MIITSGSEWEESEGKGRNFAVGLDANDAIKLVGQEKWDSLTMGQQIDFLEKRADLVVVAYMRKEGVITEEYFNLRVEQIKAR